MGRYTFGASSDVDESGMNRTFKYVHRATIESVLHDGQGLPRKMQKIL